MQRWLIEIAAAVRAYRHRAHEQARLAREIQQLRAAAAMLKIGKPDKARACEAALDLATQREALLDGDARRLLASWPGLQRTRRPGDLPARDDHGELLKWLMLENVAGSFPYTAGTLEHDSEDACGQVEHAGTTFVVGNSGVSIATLEDMEVLYSGFDLCNPSTSVSMTINGPAPTILAMFMNTAIDQQLARFRADNGREPTEGEAQKIRAWALANVRGTVQADILKEDQGQNTCIFSTEFSLKVMGDIAEYFVHHQVRNFYSVSISGYHIAEAGANPISQLAFTLSNGFTFVEAYLARGMHVDDFAPNLSFFFSNGMDPEYTVLGRVARRIWAIAMRDRYGANERSQKLKVRTQASAEKARSTWTIEALTDKVEAAVLEALEQMAGRSGLDRSGLAGDPSARKPELARTTTPEEAQPSQSRRLRQFHARHAGESPAMLARLQQAALDGRNVFEVLIDAVRVCSVGQIATALRAVEGRSAQGR